MKRISDFLIETNGKRLIWWCPGCKEHHCISTGETGWGYNNDPVKPTFIPSVLTTMGPECDPETNLAIPGTANRICHCFVRDGKIEFLSDCYHDLAGKTVDIPIYPKEI